MNRKKTVRDYIEENVVRIDDNFSIRDDENIFTSGLVNSLFAMKLITFIQKRFNVVIEDDDLNIKNFSCVENIDQFLSRKLGENTSAVE
ncbi:phosphopantetheine-binding protein [Reinekea sp. G2M2-21]|uniref:phosphopantetheine-binding protein n=1 Tax=Reinekea sp. G2M2-21 TaxID=2788942 RepID=UPI0018ABB7E4|nr:phosphopantetheine-binding protein [Reinekea sp. G2M2-21]